MFVQVIQGKVSDAEGLRRQLDRWHEELRPGAAGYLGSTSGLTDEGEFVTLVRFESGDAARRNSDRPEQGAWWAETAKCFEGEPTFRDSEDVETILAGGSDDAGFVQVMQGTVADRTGAQEIEQQFLPRLQEIRPDVIGSVRVWDGSSFTEAIYFTNEAEARKGESSMAAEDQSQYEEWMALVSDLRFLDLHDPWLR